ncbi:MAG: HAMP domain-containing protein, partial [Nitrospinae bacterium]|nr:HAMP domain-containing protein [Nitrospinota bacterium]
GLFLAFYLLMWGLSYYMSIKIGSYLDSSKIEIMKQTDILRLALADVEKNLNEAAQTKEESQVEDAEKRALDFKKALVKIRALDKDRQEDFDLLEKEFDNYYINAHEASLLIIREGELSESVIGRAKAMNQSLPPLKRDVEKILNRSYETFSNLLDRSTKMASLLVTQNFVVLVAVMMLSFIIFPMIIRSIILPIEKLVYATNEIAQGNLDAHAEVARMDEIGVLAMSFNRMARSLKDKNTALEKTTNELKASLELRKEMQKKVVDANKGLAAANARLMEADRMKSDFLASMSHELRTPLNAIINFTDQIIEDWEMLQSDKEWSQEANGMLKRVYKSSKHLLSLINDLLDLAKIESGHMTLDLGTASMRDIVSESIASVASLAKVKNLELKSSIPSNLPFFSLDERRIYQALINLLSNSIKFTEKGHVEVRVETDSRYPDGALVKVVDTGIGIPENYLTIIFDRFRQVDGGDSRKHAGTGLGLNLVKELVELHGGWVKVESEVGKGSTFTFYLPFNAQISPKNAEINLFKTDEI